MNDVTPGCVKSGLVSCIEVSIVVIECYSTAPVYIQCYYENDNVV